MASTDSQPGARSRVRSAPVIAATIAVTAVVAATQSSVAAAVLRGGLVLAVVPCAVIDIERRTIPNRITGPASLLALIAGLALDSAGEPGRLVWAALAAGFLLLAALARPSGMGMGDIKLVGVIGLCLGRPVVVALILALLGSVVAAVVIARRQGVRVARKTGLPFGPYLAAGAIVAALVGAPIIHSYLNLHP
jgi:leader peptidase (prepilin peptidase)/N-methyltransferase